MKYIVLVDNQPHKIEVREGVIPSLEFHALGNEKDGGVMPVLSFKDEAANTIAAFVGVMRYYPDTMEPKKKTWADED